MYLDSIKIDGTRANDDQKWRTDRILLILGYAQALADLEINTSYYKKIDSIYDNKGTLIITWLVPPTDKEKEYLRFSWESIVSDYETNDIVHVVM